MLESHDLAIHTLPTSQARKPKKIRHLRDFLQHILWGCVASVGLLTGVLEGGDIPGEISGEMFGGLAPSGDR
jgi:hypothetical protein